MKKQLAALALMLTAFGSANAQLQARDIDGNGSIDAFYDVQQNISWLADANYYVTQGGPLDYSVYGSTGDQVIYHPEGQIRLPTALSFVQSLVVAGLDGWRLPARIIPNGDPTGTDPRCGPAGTTCWAGGNWGNELSNMIASNANAFDTFLNVQGSFYLAYGAPVTPGASDYASWVNPYNPDFRFTTDETSIVWGYVWAVHDGDVGNGTTAAVTPVPEPETYALMLAGLLAFGLRAAKRPRQDA